MRINGFNRILVLALSSSLMLAHPLAAIASGISVENDPVCASGISAPDDSEFSALSAEDDTEASDLSYIRNPRTEGGESTWDCIWFGKYWQEDTNRDGYCFNKEIDISIKDGNPTDQDGKIYYSWWYLEEGTY